LKVDRVTLPNIWTHDKTKPSDTLHYNASLDEVSAVVVAFVVVAVIVVDVKEKQTIWFETKWFDKTWISSENEISTSWVSYKFHRVSKKLKNLGLSVSFSLGVQKQPLQILFF
jgi:hypothetical protein